MTPNKRQILKRCGVLIFAILLTCLGPVSGFCASDIDSIHIVTPEWQAQTNADGTGIFFEIVQKVYEPEGVRMKFEIMPWKRAWAMIENKKADAMLAVHKTDKSLLMPQYPLYVDYTAVLLNKGAFANWQGISSLNGKDVLWLRGYDYHLNPKLENVRLDYTEVDQHSQAVGMVQFGRADAFLDALIDLDRYLKDKSVDMEPFRLETLWSSNAYMNFAKTQRSEKLIEIYDRRIIELFKSGELKKIFEKWNVRFSPEIYTR